MMQFNRLTVIRVSKHPLCLPKKVSLQSWTKSLATSGTRVQKKEDRIITSPYRDVQLSKLPYFDYIFEKSEVHGHRTSLVNGVTNESLTHLQTMEMARSFGNALKDVLPACDVLGILLPNCIEYPVVFAGCARVKVITTTINPAYTPTEISKQLNLAGCSHIVTNSQFLPAIQETARLMEDMDEPLQVILTDKKVEGCLYLKDMIESKASDLTTAKIDVENDIITLPFSSGTTGTPKGVMLTHFNVVSNMVQSLDTHPQQRLMEESSDLDQTVSLFVLPLYHIYALWMMGLNIRTGAKMVMLPKFDPTLYVSCLSKYQPTFLNVAPPLVSFLVNSPAVESSHLDSVKEITVGAAPTGEALFKLFKKKFPHVILREGWGMTECSPVGLITPKDKVKFGSAGPALPNTKIKVIDVDNGEAVGQGKIGELCLSGPMVMKGYLNNQIATNHTIRNGWLHTGDVAYFDEEGYVYVVDRIKELIKVKGYQVPPAEIEDQLRTLEGVAYVAVIGIPHDKFGEVPKAYIVKQPGADLTEDKIKGYISTKLTSYKQLVGGVEFIDAIPKTASGKILKRILMQWNMPK